ncbi:MAG: hypothetical protein AAGC64_13990 [Bacteroidota bacterium]
MDEYLKKLSTRFYGISLIPKNLWKDYGYVLLNIAGSDGEVSDAELEWLTVECAKSIGIDEEIIVDWENFEYDEDELEELFLNLNSSSFTNFNKLLIYDAIRMCSSDHDYAEDEKDQVYHAARILKVSTETVMAIEALVELESAAEKLRFSIL